MRPTGATQLRSRPEDAEIDAVEHEIERGRSRLCDTVRLRGADDREGVVHLVEGEVAWVETRGFGLPTFRARLIEVGLLLTHEVDLVVAMCRAEKLNFAEMVIQLGLVGEDDLVATLREHVHESMQAILAMRELTGSWSRGTLSFTGELTIPLDDVLTMAELERWALIIAHAGGSLSDRRVDERLPLHVLASVLTPRGPLLMMTENVSMSGGLMRSPCEIAPGTRVTVRVSIGVQKLSLPGRVVRVRKCTLSSPHAIAVSWELDEAERCTLRAALSQI